MKKAAMLLLLTGAAAAAGDMPPIHIEVFLAPAQMLPVGWQQAEQLIARNGDKLTLWRLQRPNRQTAANAGVALRHTLQSFARAALHRVQTVPAVVIDGGAPVYGTHNLASLYGAHLAKAAQSHPRSTKPSTDAPRLTAADTSSFSLHTLAKGWIKGMRQKDCLNYCVTGICLYLICSPLGCAVKAKPKIRHRLPDLVVSSWHRGKHPWRELRAPLAALAKTLEVSSGATGTLRSDSARTATFREADVFANPLATLPIPGLCKARTRPWQPHYSSLMDAPLWRSGLSELLNKDSWDLEAWNIGKKDERWGNLFPRKGFGHYNTPPQGALVSAQRALDIAEEGGLHLYLKIPSGDGRKTASRNPPGRKGRISKDACWQQIHPVISDECRTAAPPQSLNAPAYAWQLWTEYECCLPGAGELIAVESFKPICLQ